MASFQDDAHENLLWLARELCLGQQTEDTLGVVSDGLPDDIKAVAIQTVDHSFDQGRLEVNEASIAFLREVMDCKEQPTELVLLAGASLCKALKVEPALLATDPDEDLASSRAAHTVSLSALCDRYERHDDQDSPQQHSKGAFTQYETHIEAIHKAQLEIDMDTIEYLRRALLAAVCGADEGDDGHCFRLPNQPYTNLRLSSPALPISPLPSRPISPRSLYEVEYTSSADNLIARDATLVMGNIFGQDSLPVNDDALHFAQCSDTPSPPLPTRAMRRKSDLLKIEEPVTPFEARQERPIKKLKLDIDAISPDGSEDDFRFSDFFDEGSFYGMVSQKAVPLVSVLENEGLDNADTLLRLQVPVMDAVVVVPPWQEICNDRACDKASHETILAELIQGLWPKTPVWKGGTRLEMNLPWNLCARGLRPLKLDESLDNARTIDTSFLVEPEVIDVHSLVPNATRPLAKRGGNGEDSPEALTKLHDSCRSTAENMLRMKGSFLCSNEGMPDSIKEMAPVPSTHEAKPLTTPFTQTTSILGLEELIRHHHIDFGLTRDEAKKSTFVHDVASFMKMRGCPLPPETDSLREPGSIVPPVPTAVMVAPTESVPEQLQPECLSFVCPSYPRLDNPEAVRQVVIYPQLSTNFSLTRTLRRILPGLDLIERDLPLIINEKAGHRLVSGQYEADMTLGPGRGLICTSLRKLQQKALPGQAHRFGVQQRVTALIPRYESLLVLVGMPGLDDRHTVLLSLDERDEKAIREFMVFTTRLQAKIEVILVPENDTGLAHWIAAAINRHGLAGPNGGPGPLLHDETLWERLLRAAGLDAFAAQMILVQLKRSTEDKQYEVSKHDGAWSGLASLMRMAPKDRLAQLSPIVGGQRVLLRFAAAVDGSWPSALGVT